MKTTQLLLMVIVGLSALGMIACKYKIHTQEEIIVIGELSLTPPPKPDVAEPFMAERIPNISTPEVIKKELYPIQLPSRNRKGER